MHPNACNFVNFDRSCHGNEGHAYHQAVMNKGALGWGRFVLPGVAWGVGDLGAFLRDLGCV